MSNVIDMHTGRVDAYRQGLVDELEAWEAREARRGGRVRRARRSLAGVLRALAEWVAP